MMSKEEKLFLEQLSESVRTELYHKWCLLSDADRLLFSSASGEKKNRLLEKHIEELRQALLQTPHEYSEYILRYTGGLSEPTNFIDVEEELCLDISNLVYNSEHLGSLVQNRSLEGGIDSQKMDELLSDLVYGSQHFGPLVQDGGVEDWIDLQEIDELLSEEEVRVLKLITVASECMQLNANRSILKDVKEERDSKTKPNRTAVALFCSLVNQSGIVKQVGTNQAFVKAICSKYNFEYVDRIRQEYTPVMRPTTKHLKVLRSTVLPMVDNETTGIIESYLKQMK